MLGSNDPETTMPLTPALRDDILGAVEAGFAGQVAFTQKFWCLSMRSWKRWFSG